MAAIPSHWSILAPATLRRFVTCLATTPKPFPHPWSQPSPTVSPRWLTQCGLYVEFMTDKLITGLSDLAACRLPLNRKERFYTGTVLPMIVTCDEFAHFDRFLELCGVPKVAVVSDPNSTNVQFFTEYGFKESLVAGAETRFRDPEGKDTPDLVVYVESNPSVLLGIEAKVFSRPPVSKIRQQVQRQTELLSVMAAGIGTQPEIHQVALLPSGLEAGERIADTPVLTWELLANTFRDIAPPYWIGVLDQALERYEGLVSRVSEGGQNKDSDLRGDLIVKQWWAGDREYLWMGCQGGINGKRLRKELESGRWQDKMYEVRRKPLPDSANWFSIESFVQKLTDSQATETRESGAEKLRRDTKRVLPQRTASTADRSPWKGAGRNADDKIRGQEIYDRYAAGDFTFTWMGRTGGRQGAELLEDLKTDRWRNQNYEVRRERISGNRNWFPIKSFVDGINLRKPRT